MKRKTFVIFICILLVVTSISSVTGSKFAGKGENSSCGLANIIKNYENEDFQSQSNIISLNNEDEQFYAYNVYDPGGILVEGPVYFTPEDPGIITQLAPTTSTDFISGGTWTDNGEWYGCEYGAYGNPNIWIIDITTGDMSLVGSYDPEGTGLSFNSLAFDNTSGIMYGCSSDALYTVNMTTGASTLIGSFDLSVVSYMIGIAFDENGNLYGDELTTDSLYKIDPSTGKATLIGPLGIDINFAQDMAYDIDNKILYLSAYTNLPLAEGALYTCNTNTGFATKVGRFQGNAQITALAIPFKAGGPPPIDEIPPVTTHEINPSEPNGENGWYVSSIKVTINPIDNESGVAWTNYSLNDGKSWITHSGPQPFEFSIGEGEHQLLYYSVDNAGNVETLRGPYNLNIDTVPPDKRWFCWYILKGPDIVAIICIGAVRDILSGVDRVEFLLNDEYHHEMDVSVWPVGAWCPIIWFLEDYSPGDFTTGIVYDKAGNSEELRPQNVPKSISPISYRP